MSAIKPIRERLDAATPGPWSFDDEGNIEAAENFVVSTEFGVGYQYDSAFIANAPQDIRTLLGVADLAEGFADSVVETISSFQGGTPMAQVKQRLDELVVQAAVIKGALR